MNKKNTNPVPGTEGAMPTKKKKKKGSGLLGRIIRRFFLVLFTVVILAAAALVLVLNLVFNGNQSIEGANEDILKAIGAKV